MILPGAKIEKVREKHTQDALCQGDALDTGAAICTLPRNVEAQKFALSLRRFLQAKF
jgi:hypothetical protein